jgi:beta-lactamase regulating signal transducer with metallopeptidase domain
MLARLLMSFLSIRRIVRTAEAVPGDPQHGGIVSKRFRVLVSSDIDGPLCFGMLRPVILLPKSLYTDGTPEELRMVLSHELAHVERRDGWINLFQRIVESFLFFHPWVW